MDGDPVSIQVFRGNTPDTTTVADQISKLCERFKVLNLTFVGNRGMLKSPQIESLPRGFHYITTITKPQINKMLREKKFHISDFKDSPTEVSEGKERYILRRNPVRQQEIFFRGRSFLINIDLNSAYLIFLQKV